MWVADFLCSLSNRRRVKVQPSASTFTNVSSFIYFFFVFPLGACFQREAAYPTLLKSRLLTLSSRPSSGRQRDFGTHLRTHDLRSNAAPSWTLLWLPGKIGHWFLLGSLQGLSLSLPLFSPSFHCPAFSSADIASSSSCCSWSRSGRARAFTSRLTAVLVRYFRKEAGRIGSDKHNCRCRQDGRRRSPGEVARGTLVQSLVRGRERRLSKRQPPRTREHVPSSAGAGVYPTRFAGTENGQWRRVKATTRGIYHRRLSDGQDCV